MRKDRSTDAFKSLAFGPLNRLSSRAAVQRALKHATQDADKSNRPFGIVLFSIDRFKLINGRFGHERGDFVLQEVANTVANVLRGRGKIARWGGDEFLCLLPHADPLQCARIAEELRHAVEILIVPIESSLINTTASFGVACYPRDKEQANYLVVAADEALHHAKRTGRNRVVNADELRNQLFRMGSVLETALREERVMPAYQPIVDLQTGEVVAEEALARIITTDGEVIAADEFIDVASQFHLIHKIDRTIVLSAFNRSAANNSDMTYFINISGDVLRHPAVLREMLNWTKLYCIDENGHPRNKPLVIEVTERELISNLDETRRTLEPFLDCGLRLALDDFGSGYSSFQYLADLPVSYLKIDGRLIRRIHEPKVRAIVRGIQNIAGELELITLAEYVEDERQADILRTIGVNWAQGHYYGGAKINKDEANIRRELSVNWAHGYYYQKDLKIGDKN